MNEHRPVIHRLKFRCRRGLLYSERDFVAMNIVTKRYCSSIFWRNARNYQEPHLRILVSGSSSIPPYCLVQFGVRSFGEILPLTIHFQVWIDIPQYLYSLIPLHKSLQAELIRFNLKKCGLNVKQLQPPLPFFRDERKVGKCDVNRELDLKTVPHFCASLLASCRQALVAQGTGLLYWGKVLDHHSVFNVVGNDKHRQTSVS
jgi:hypothetical protein